MPTIASLEGDSMPLKWNPLGLGNLGLFGFCLFFFPSSVSEDLLIISQPHCVASWASGSTASKL